jgi:hypothetical protein
VIKITILLMYWGGHSWIVKICIKKEEDFRDTL